MQKIKRAEKTIQRIGNKKMDGTELHQAIYRNLGVRHKLNRTVTPAYIRRHIVSEELLYHPFWMAKNMVVAERPPFPPKKIPRIIFVDALSGYRGLFSHVPVMSEENVEAGRLTEPRIKDEDTAEKYILDVQVRQINRSYMLKKPRHEVKEISLVYLPIWKVKVESPEFSDTFYINCNTGESERFLSERWRNGKDLLE